MESSMPITNSQQETNDFAIAFAKKLPVPAIVQLEGEMGAGKTCFVRGLCEGLGGDPRQVSSPTFSIVQEYEVANGNRLIHIDAYRLSGEDELESIGWDELLQDADAIIAIEWPSKIKKAIPAGALLMNISHIDFYSREIEEVIAHSVSGDNA
jgi:tRNA threonylcarbamoyladenosine biosynthesis protein TsaE